MKTLLIGTALALAAGTVQQRAAHALRRSLARHSTLSHLTIDVWGHEWPARARMAAGDRLMAARRHPGAEGARGFLALATAEPAILPTEVSRRPPTALLQEPWMNPRRRARIIALALEIRPDVIVITDPLLADLAPYLRWPGIRLVLLDNGLAGWAEHASAMTLGSEQSQWLRLLAEVSTSDLGKMRRLFDRIVPGLGADATTPTALLPLELATNELFFSKTRNLVVPATGYSWFDRQVLVQVQAFLDYCNLQGIEPPNLVLTGFAPGLLRGFADAEIHSDWQKLQNSVGAARCLYVPVLTPALAQLALAAVAVGTPVLTTRRGAALYGLVGQPGIFAEISTTLSQALAQILDDDLLGPAAYRAIAQAAIPLTDTAAQERLMRLILQDNQDVGLPDAALPLATPAFSEIPPRRVPPCSAAPVVLYNPATRMLLLRLQLLISAQIDEVRLLDFAGFELNRLAPPAPPGRGHILTMEGGVVVETADLAGGLLVELHDPFGLVASHRIPVAQFETLRGEIAMAHLDDNMLRGAFWVLDNPEAGPTDRFAVGFAPQKTAASLLGARAMQEIGASAVPFAVPLPASLTPQTECLLWSGPAGAALQTFTTPVQRPHRETNASLNARYQPRGAIAALKNIHAGKRAWIVGNGPSVRLDDLAAIPADDVTFCFNRFYLSYADNPLRETYVVSADTLMIQDFGQEMIDLAAGLPLFCLPPSRLPPLSGDYVLLPPGDHYLPLFSQNPEKFVTVGGSSVFVALQMAWYMGIRDVVLYGMDYSFSVKMQRDPRFPFPVSFEEGNHFIKSYRGAKPWCPPTWRDISAGFINARVAFELTGGRILNATRGGRLQTFARADFDEICQSPVWGITGQGTQGDTIGR